MIYHTRAGSTVSVTGPNAGIHAIAFDWFEEWACCEAVPVADCADPGDAWLRWHCDCCDDGAAQLHVGAT